MHYLYERNDHGARQSRMDVIYHAKFLLVGNFFIDLIVIGADY